MEKDKEYSKKYSEFLEKKEKSDIALDDIDINNSPFIIIKQKFSKLKDGLFDAVVIAKTKIKSLKKDESKGLKSVELKLKKVEEHDEQKAVKKKIEEQKKFQSNLDLVQSKRKNKVKVVVTHYERKKRLKDYLLKAGYEVSDENNISKKINVAAIIFCALFSLYLLRLNIFREDTFLLIFTKFFLTWMVFLPALIVIFWSVFYFAIDFRIYNRKKELELVLPDFLQLTSANLNAGMPLDKALWFAIRPRFGILAKEIEDIAKSTLVGEELSDALQKFSNKYESNTLKRTINLILEGIDSGGEIGPLLNKISLDIQNTYLIKRDMAANVTTYVIFISFATVAAAPFLFGLANQMLIIVQSIIANVDVGSSSSSGMMSMNFDADSVSKEDFMIFSVTMLAMTSFFSAMIVSVIQKGNIKDGIRNIPGFILISLTLFFIAMKVFGSFLGGLIG